MSANPAPLKIESVVAAAESKVTGIRGLFAQVREASALVAELRAKFEKDRTVASFERLAAAQRDADEIARALGDTSEAEMIEAELIASLQLNEKFWLAAAEDMKALAGLAEKRAREAAPAVAREVSDAILAGVDLTAIPSYDSPLGSMWHGVLTRAGELAALRSRAREIAAEVARFERFASNPEERAAAPSDMQHVRVVARLRGLQDVLAPNTK